ncbi:hypothetical protein F5883DRAFT_622864 [Diaporthe sp. PMI_573]|nr:hypothetical protein F5883DRAFT_622864 [Diaporthaceae sp. PMI_573]
MLRHSFRAFSGTSPTSVAQVPLVSLIGAYFCRLVTKNTNDGGSSLVDLDHARKAVSAEMNENLSILFRLLKQNALTQEQVDSFRSTTGQMKQWARACSELMSLGAIHAFARTQWVSWHVRIIGSNSVPLQIFLYLCEKRRLQSSEDMSGSSEYEGLVGALLEDQRVAPHLLMNGRPRTVSECITALRHWCHLPTLDGDTLSDGDAGLTRKHTEAIENSSVVRNTSLLHEDIAQNGFCVTKKMYDRLPADERKKSFTDDTTLLRYLNWEMSAPSCLKLESALFKAIQTTSEWDELRVAALLSVVQHQSGWQKALLNVVTGGLETLSELQRSPGACGVIVLDQSLEIAALEAALRVPGAMLKNLSTRGIDIESPMYERQRFRRKRALHPDDKESVERNSGIHRRGGPDR